MKIETSQVIQIKISEVDGLDPITVFMEDIRPGAGKITISCYGESWTGYWGAMGDRNLAQFFIDCNAEYLAGGMGRPRVYEYDQDATEKAAKELICKERRGGELSKRDARELFDEVETGLSSENHDLLNRVFGSEWHYSLCERVSGEHTYFCKIICAVKDALEQMASENELDRA